MQTGRHAVGRHTPDKASKWKTCKVLIDWLVKQPNYGGFREATQMRQDQQ